MSKSNCYWIYILECENGSYYTGYTRNLAKRYKEHTSGLHGAKYTRGFRPLRIAQCWRLYDTKGTAMKIEYLIKSSSRKRKDILVSNPDILKKIVFDKFNANINIISSNPELIQEDILN
ncbi:MAG: GIY-YIG nuclease family protein [Spirochaetota bacterium]|nr:GIY-YIG nuclease family protein [Spirochaetota bacterium]